MRYIACLAYALFDLFLFVWTGGLFVVSGIVGTAAIWLVWSRLAWGWKATGLIGLGLIFAFLPFLVEPSMLPSAIARFLPMVTARALWFALCSGGVGLGYWWSTHRRARELRAT